MKLAWSGPTAPLILSEEVTRPSLKKAGDVIVHFPLKVKLQFDVIFVSKLRGVYLNTSIFGRKLIL